jgi:Flp pilus assembly protein TadG
MFIRLRQLLRRGRGQEGAAAVEFAILLLPLLLLIGGGVDFGHAYYIQHVITTASREGARYGVKYKVDSSTGLPFAPSALTPSISNYVKLPQPTGLGYAGLLSSDANLLVTPSGVGYTSNNPGDPLIVTVTASKHWFFLGGLLGFPNPKTLTATAAMTLER